MNILETRSLDHDFGGLGVLNDVNLEIKKGEKHAIIGPNGAGKTTLFNVITGTYTPSKGTVVFKQKNITGLGACKIQRLGMGRSFQITATFDNLSAFQNIRLAVLSRRGIRFDFFRFVDKMDDVTEETVEILQRVDLWDDCHTPAGMLSYGKHRSLEISMALATNPDLVMLDEPTEGLSPIMVKTVRDVLKEISRSGISILLVEYNFKMVMSAADRVYLMGKANIGYSGTVEELENDAQARANYLEV